MKLGKRGIALEKRGMAPRHAKSGKGKHYSVVVQSGFCQTWSDRFSGDPAQIILRFHVLQISQSVIVPDHNHINKPPVKEK